MEIEQGEEEARFKNVIKNIEEFYTTNLFLNEHEVAIFLPNKERTVLSFACPDYLIDSGMIPINSTEAVTATIFRTGRSIIENNFQQTKHLSIFEIIRTPDKKVIPIWKMMATSIAVGDEKIGVIEISRRSPHPEDAGEDFTERDLMFLQTTIQKIAPYLRAVLPENFRGKIT